MKINIDYIARVEGEASVKVEIKDGRTERPEVEYMGTTKIF